MDSKRLKRMAGGTSRVPPGQFLTDKFPVLTYGPTPRVDLKEWKFHVLGLVEAPFTLTWEEFMALPKIQVVADFHCVTQWSRLNNEWEGVSFREVMKLAKPKPEAKFVMVFSDLGYTTNLALEDLMEENVLFAYRHDGNDLEPDHGWPLRLVVPKLYGWKSAKWVRGLDFMAEEKPGFWEDRGYHMRGDPWREERYWE